MPEELEQLRAEFVAVLERLDYDLSVAETLGDIAELREVVTDALRRFRG